MPPRSNRLSGGQPRSMSRTETTSFAHPCRRPPGTASWESEACSGRRPRRRRRTTRSLRPVGRPVASGSTAAPATRRPHLGPGRPRPVHAHHPNHLIELDPRRQTRRRHLVSGEADHPPNRRRELTGAAAGLSPSAGRPVISSGVESRWGGSLSYRRRLAWREIHLLRDAYVPCDPRSDRSPGLSRRLDPDGRPRVGPTPDASISCPILRGSTDWS
jgi:hypothetical protein